MTDNDIPMLLEWMQDMNWPGTSTITRFIKNKGTATLEPVRSALKVGDSIWNYWLLNKLGDAFDVTYWKSLLPELQHISSLADDESAHIEALIILARYSLLPRNDIDNLARMAKSASRVSPQDYSRLDELLANS